MTTYQTLSEYYDTPLGQYATLREKIAAEKISRTRRYAHFAEIWKHATDAGHAAALAYTPTPMVVAEHTDMLDDSSPIKQSWEVSGGVCGFASIHLPKGTTSFAHWAKKHAGFGKAYRKGLSLSVMGYGQSMERKEVFAHTVVGILKENGIGAYSSSRMD